MEAKKYLKITYFFYLYDVIGCHNMYQVNLCSIKGGFPLALFFVRNHFFRKKKSVNFHTWNYKNARKYKGEKIQAHDNRIL